MDILITGGLGYLGSHTLVQYAQRHPTHQLIVVDNLSNACLEVLTRVDKLMTTPPIFHQVDLRDKHAIDAVFQQHRIEAVMHFAGLKAVGESVEQPITYFDNNVTGTLHLIQAMQAHQVWQLIFSSSATVYGDAAEMPIAETAPTGQTTNPYGRSKDMIEKILSDWAQSESKVRCAALRYFNPVGAHPSGTIGEHPQQRPNNLMPYLLKVALGQLPCLHVFGDDYLTKDGTGVRDYIHVLDLANGHIQALEYLQQQPGFYPFNLGTGQGYSVLEIIKAFEQISQQPLPYNMTARRPGDIACCYADVTRATQQLGWRAERNLTTMLTDAWRWQQNNPQGYLTPVSTRAQATADALI